MFSSRYAIRILLFLVTVLIFSAGFVSAGWFNFPRVTSMMRVMGMDQQPLPFTIHHIRTDHGAYPTCLLVLRDDSTGQFDTVEVNISNCEVPQ